MQFDPYNTLILKNCGAAPSLKLHYFGPLRIELNGTPVTMRTTKTAALLVYLALEGKQPQPRTHLAALLWDGYGQQTARSSLRVALTYLRQALLPLQPIHILHKCVQWNSTQAESWCDVLAFEEALLSLAEQSTPARVEEVMALAKHEFLTGWENVDSAPFQKWVLKRRAHYQALINNLQQRLATRPPVTARQVAVPRHRHNLRRPLTPLVGRAETVDDLCQKLLDPQYPLLVLVGEGGIGKTRLALATAWSLVAMNVNRDYSGMTAHRTALSFPDGIWFIPLNELIPQALTGSDDVAERVAAAISTTLSLPFSKTELVVQQLLSWLSQKALLLILDGFEHLKAADAFLSMLVQSAYRVKVLVTSRRRLNLQAATSVPVQELATPEMASAASATVEQLRSYPSIQLFVERVQRIRMDFQLDPQNGATIAQICHLVGGMPLGIELAAAMMTIYSASKIVEQLTQDAVNLQMTWADLSPWHRNIEQMLATSWQLLTTAEAHLLAQCTTMINSFSLAAALQISGATAVTLRTLVEKSLLRQHNLEADLFTMHELVRHYARRQLQQMPALEAHTRARHAAYYLTLLQEQETAIPNELSARQIIYAKLENIRAAWAWSCEAADVALLETAHEALAWFYRVVASYTEAFTAFEQAATALAQPLVQTAHNDERRVHLQAKLLILAAEFGRKIGRVEESKQHLQAAQAISQQLGDATLLALSYKELALVAQAQGDYAQLEKFSRQGVELAQQTNNPQVRLFCWQTLALACAYNNHPSELYDIYFTIHQLLQATPNRYLEAIVVMNLGSMYREQYEYTLALDHLQHALDCKYALKTPIISYTYLALGYLWYEVGGFAQAQKLFTQASTFLYTQSHPIGQIALQRGFGLLQQMLGNVTAAHQHMTLALKSAQETQNAQLEYQVLLEQGDILMTMDAVQAAVETYERALTLSLHLGDPVRVVDAHAALAKLRLAQQELPAAQSAVDTALTIFAQQGLRAAWYPFRVYWYCYQVLQALADPRTTPLLEQAHSKLMQIAESIQDQALRHSFLENVPANRALIDAASRGYTTAGPERTRLSENKRTIYAS